MLSRQLRRMPTTHLSRLHIVLDEQPQPKGDRHNHNTTTDESQGCRAVHHSLIKRVLAKQSSKERKHRNDSSCTCQHCSLGDSTAEPERLEKRLNFTILLANIK